MIGRFSPDITAWLATAFGLAAVVCGLGGFGHEGVPGAVEAAGFCEGADGEDGLSSGDAPSHAGALHSLRDQYFAGGFDQPMTVPHASKQDVRGLRSRRSGNVGLGCSESGSLAFIIGNGGDLRREEGNCFGFDIPVAVVATALVDGRVVQQQCE